MVLVCGILLKSTGYSNIKKIITNIKICYDLQCTPPLQEWGTLGNVWEPNKIFINEAGLYE